MGCAHNTEYMCASCEDAAHAMEHPEIVDGCRICKFATIQVGQAVRPKKPVKDVPIGGWNNSWERGYATDHRGMALLDGNLEPIPLKKYAENRSKYDARRKELATSPNPFGAEKG